MGAKLAQVAVTVAAGVLGVVVGTKAAAVADRVLAGAVAATVMAGGG